MNFWSQIFEDYTLRTIVLGTALIGASCGVLGSFSVLRKQSLLGDAISHAALPGIALAFLIVESKDFNILLLGALISGLIGTLWIQNIIKRTHLKSDTALGIILSCFFGFGLLLLTYIQKLPNAQQAGLDKYLYGQAASLIESDINLIFFVSLISILALLLVWKELKLFLFDQDYFATLGFNSKLINYIISTFIVLAIVMGLQTVGVVLMSAMLLAPAAAARQWTNNFSKMITLAGVFGALSGVFGTLISAQRTQIPTGPVIVLVASVFVVLSFLCAPQRGIISKQLKIIKNRRTLDQYKTLNFMYQIAQSHQNIYHPHSIKLLNNFQGYTKKTLQQLIDKNLVEIHQNQWNLTQKGFNIVENLYQNND